MEKLEFARVGEQMYHEKLENSLNVFVFPKPDFQRGYAFFATNYGGMDMRFCLNGEWHDQGGQRPSGAGRQRSQPQRLHQQRHHRLLLRVHREV